MKANKGADGKEKTDEKRAVTYGAGVVLESNTFQIPIIIKIIEKKYWS